MINLETYKGVILETDIIASSLLEKEQTNESITYYLIRKPCYTTVIQITEMLEVSDSPQEEEIISKGFIGLRILGLHPRYSKSIAQNLKILNKIHPEIAFRCAVTAAISQESLLPIITKRFYAVYSRLENVLTIKPDDIR